jgi:putative ABC transport system permease protein
VSFLLRTWAFVLIAAKRIMSQWGLALVTILGLIASISLIVSIPLYADAVYHRTYLEKVFGSPNPTNPDEASSLPFSFKLNYYGGWSGNKEWEDVQSVDQYLTQSSEQVLGLPEKIFVRYFSTDKVELYPNSAQKTGFVNPGERLDWVNIGFLSGLEGQIQVVEGTFPAVADPSKDSAINVLISLPLANKIGLQVGETYIVLATISTSDTANSAEDTFVQFPIRIAGIWQPIDAASPNWMDSPSSLINVLLVPEESFTRRISSGLTGEINTAVWYMVMDGATIRTSDVAGFLHRINRLVNQAKIRLPYLQVSQSPVEALMEYQRASGQLTILLYSVNTPIIGLILAFISLIASLSLERRRNEIAIMRSRGATAAQMLLSIAVESIILGLVAFAISLPLALWITQLISQTRSFMDFSSVSLLQIRLSTPALLAGILAVVSNLIITLIPAIGVVKQNIVSYKQDRARSLRPPVWQRIWLDVLLLFPVGYGTYLLSKQGSVLAWGTNDPLGNPLLFLIPALGVLAFTLLFLRLIPLMMATLAWVASHTRDVALLLAARQLSRSPGYYNTPMLILVFTLSLSTYTASLAQTLDRHLYTRIYYQVGADMKFTDIGEPKLSAPFPIPGQEEATQPEFLFFPVSEYLNIPGIEAVTRVGSYPAIITSIDGSMVNGRFYGIDRIDFPKVAYWQDNFSPYSLGALMNALAATPDGILVPEQYLEQTGLAVGDALELAISTDIGRVDMRTTIVDSFYLFPTWYPEDVPLFVGNLDYLFEQTQGESPYQVWVKTIPDIDTNQLGNVQIRDLNFRVIRWQASRPQIQEIQQRPEQQGLFGFLFIGFTAAAVLTVVGFLLHTLFSYQRQFIELGILRAGGLSRLQMATYMAFELIFLILFGCLVGTGLGILISARYIPYLQIGVEPAERFPPFQIMIAWSAIFRIYAIFSCLFLITLTVLVMKLRRMRIFQAIKLGETV